MEKDRDDTKRKIVMQIVFETINIYFKNRGIFFSKYSSSSDYSKLLSPVDECISFDEEGAMESSSREVFFFLFLEDPNLSLSLSLSKTD